jgi:hypothetical protein
MGTGSVPSNQRLNRSRLKRQKRRVARLVAAKKTKLGPSIFITTYNTQKGDEILRHLKQINKPDKLFACGCDSHISLFHVLSIVSYSP